MKSKDVKFFFDLNCDDIGEYDEVQFEEKGNQQKLQNIATFFYKNGIGIIAGDILDIEGPAKGGDSVSYLVVNRTLGVSIYHNSISYSLQIHNK